MIPLFVGLTVANIACLAVATAFGYAAQGNASLASWHIFLGALSALTCIAVHCVVFTYFAATSKWVQHAVHVKHLDEALIAPTRSFKAQAFPAAMGAMAIVLVTAFLGAASDNYGGPWPLWHHLFAIAAVLVNLVVAMIEYRAIERNGRLIDEVLSKIGSGT